MLDAVDRVSKVASMGMFRMPLTVFHPGKENETRNNHYGVDNSKSSHFSTSSLSKMKPTRSGIIVAIIPTINIQYFKLDGFANCATTNAAKSILAIS
ncbi:MAG: hypothetical protein NUV74_14110 [Candidatus Brocadiaceae bacterium]|nr:hypothetical protein [Candidatus Brocadiaceae bacterium]